MADAKDNGIKVEIRLGLRSLEKGNYSYFVVVRAAARVRWAHVSARRQTR